MTLNADKDLKGDNYCLLHGVIAAFELERLSKAMKELSEL
jgi:hypothetical protein